MKVLALVTYTDCENKWRSLQAAGHQVEVVQYDNRPHDRHHELIDIASHQDHRPDFIVFIGAVERYHGRPVPRPDIFRRLRDVAPIIHMCNDAADPPWWPDLELYDREDCFTVQVNIDGSLDTPITSFKNGMTLLTPVDSRVFEPFPDQLRWDGRRTNMGMVGGIGHTQRFATLTHLVNKGLLTFDAGPVGRSYEEMARRMLDTRVTVNYGCTGSGTRFHVKGRVVEAGMAGCCLFELAGTPTSHWFVPGRDYVEYSGAEHAAELMTSMPEADLLSAASNLHRRVVAEHHPRVFWGKVLARAGVADKVAA